MDFERERERERLLSVGEAGSLGLASSGGGINEVSTKVERIRTSLNSYLYPHPYFTIFLIINTGLHYRYVKWLHKDLAELTLMI